MKQLIRLTAALLATTAATPPVLAADLTGKEVFDHYCSWCHAAADGPGAMQLARTRGKDQALLTERRKLDPHYIEDVVRHGLKAMPPFAPSDLNDARLKALVAFLAKQG